MTPNLVLSKATMERPKAGRNKRSSVLIDTLGLLGSNPSLGLKEVSARLGVCTSYFRETLTATTGLSPMRLKENIRLCLALRQMITGNDLSRIGRQAGYRSYKAFQLAFKRRLGQSPAGFARSLKSEPKEDAVRQAIHRTCADGDTSILEELLGTFDEMPERQSTVGPELTCSAKKSSHISL